MKNIYDLTNLLRDVRKCYQTEYIDATETEKKELEVLERDYKAGTPTYTAKKQEIQLACVDHQIICTYFCQIILTQFCHIPLVHAY